MDEAKKEIKKLRDEIDAIDAELAPLINQRARLAVKIGHIKRTINMTVFDAEREGDVLKHVTLENGGPLESEGLKRIFKAIIAESRALEKERSTKQDE